MCITALGLRTAIDNMDGYEDDALQIQITVFEEHQLADENQLPQKSHQQLFNELRSKVRLQSVCSSSRLHYLYTLGKLHLINR